MVISLNKIVFIYEKCYSCNYIVIGYYLKDNDISKCNRILTSRNSPEGTVPFWFLTDEIIGEFEKTTFFNLFYMLNFI